MVDVVVIAGTKRGGHRVSLPDLRQMAGRAGRKADASDVVVRVVCDSDAEYDRVSVGMENAKLLVKSSLGETKAVAFAVLAEIEMGLVTSEEEICEWFSRSLAARQGADCDGEEVMKWLLFVRAVEKHDDKVVCTSLGRLAARYYYDPEDVSMWTENFERLNAFDYMDDNIALAWAIGSVPCGRNCYAPARWSKKELFDYFISELEDRGLSCLSGCLDSCLLWWRMLGGPNCGWSKAEIDARRSDFGRLSNVLFGLSHDRHWELESELSDLETAVAYSCPIFAASLCRLDGVGKTMACELYSMGVRSVGDLQRMAEDCESEEMKNRILGILKANESDAIGRGCL